MDPSQTISAYQPPDSDTESGNQERPPQDAPAKLGCLGAARVVLARYGKMLLESHDFFSILASIFMWIVLAGFLVLPGSFPEIQNFVNKQHELSKVVRFMRNIPLLTLGIGCCVVGGIGLLLLVVHHWGNYDWLVGNIFIPGMSDGLAGLISTFVNLYGSGAGVHYGATTIVTLAVTGGCTVICGLLAVICAVLKILDTEMV
ncbi:hypothetical protein V8E52_007612 [Russula decolorans]